jgi:glycosyltransferase involved in cell wall biosynthesis
MGNNMSKAIINGNILYIPDDDCKYTLNNKIVLHIILPQPEGNLGGSDTHVLYLSHEQKNNSQFAPIVLFRRNNFYGRLLEEMGIAYIDGTHAKNLFLLARSLKNIPNRLSISLIHSHQYSANYLTYLTKKINKKYWGKIDTLMTCHGWIENNLKDRISTFCDFFTYRTAKGLIAVCKKDELRLQKKVNGKFISCIKNGIVIPTVNGKKTGVSELIEKYSIPKNKKLLAIVGRLSPEKRIDIFLKFADELLKHRNDVHFLIVGKGNEEDKLRKLAVQMGIEDNITFTGFIADINIIYTAIDILLLTSDTEGTPRVVLECMSNRKSVIATNVGGLNEIIDHGVNGVLVEKGDFWTMAENADRLLEDNICLEKLRNEAYKKIIQNFSIQSMQELIEKFYLKLLKEQGGNNYVFG